MPMAPSPDPAASLAAAAREIHSSGNVDTTLRTIVSVAQTVVPGMEHVGISLSRRGGDVVTGATTDDFVLHMDTLQYEEREGPCLQAITSEPLVVAPHLAVDARWPRYAPRASREGVRSQLGVRLSIDETTFGSLNFYSTSSDTIDPHTPRLASLFATHATLALDRAQQLENLNGALATRTTIGAAVGIVMERYHLDEDRAFAYLVRVSQAGNIKLRDVAAELVRHTGNAALPSHQEEGA
jgi:GAF domain-containing protein